MSDPHVESVLAVGYALFLLLAALGLDRLARHSHERSFRYRTAGFSYEPAGDAWICPEGERLHRIDTDHELRIARYRARAHVCNACRLKEACTDSSDGREIGRPLDPWPHSEAGRFHRGIALVIVGIAALVLAAAAALNPMSGDLVVLLAGATATGIAAIHLLAAFRDAPSGFPWGEREPRPLA